MPVRPTTLQDKLLCSMFEALRTGPQGTEFLQPLSQWSVAAAATGHPILMELLMFQPMTHAEARTRSEPWSISQVRRTSLKAPSQAFDCLGDTTYITEGWMIGCTRAFRLWKVMWDCHTSQKDKAAMRALQLENGDVFVDVLMENVRKYVQY